MTAARPPPPRRCGRRGSAPSAVPSPPRGSASADAGYGCDAGAPGAPCSRGCCNSAGGRARRGVSVYACGTCAVH
eukprot:4362302-Prymnesium_polylepis.1